MENLVRLPKTELYEDEVHVKPFLYWIQEQVERISKFADVITELQDEAKRKAVSPAKVHECAAKFTEFYTKNIAFKSIYEELAEPYVKSAEELHDKMYLEVKEETATNTKRANKYKKKEATQKELEMEIKTHSEYEDYLKDKAKADEFLKKAKTQEDFIKSLGKQDQILNLLQRASTAELKYLHLET